MPSDPLGRFAKDSLAGVDGGEFCRGATPISQTVRIFDGHVMQERLPNSKRKSSEIFLTIKESPQRIFQNRNKSGLRNVMSSQVVQNRQDDATIKKCCSSMKLQSDSLSFLRVTVLVGSGANGRGLLGLTLVLVTTS